MFKKLDEEMFNSVLLMIEEIERIEKEDDFTLGLPVSSKSVPHSRKGKWAEVREELLERKTQLIEQEGAWHRAYRAYFDYLRDVRMPVKRRVLQLKNEEKEIKKLYLPHE
jgi:hypothetical protein